MGVLGPAGAVVGLALVAFSGCLGGSSAARYLEGTFSVPVSSWSPGFSWTYKSVTESHTQRSDSHGFQGASGGTQPPEFHRVTVLNTTKTVLGSPAYFATYERFAKDPAGSPAESAKVSSSLQLDVYRKSDLHKVGVGYFYGFYPVAGADCIEGECYAPLYGYPTNSLRVGEDLTPLPAPRFPLEPGATWSPSGSGSLALNYTARVEGRQVLDLDDGSHTAVHIHVFGYLPPAAQKEWMEDILPSRYEVVDGELLLAYSGDYWWGDAERNLVHAQTRYSVTYAIDAVDDAGEAYSTSGTIESTSEQTLASYSLRAEAESPVPAYTISGEGDADLDHVLRLTLEHDAYPVVDVGAGPADVAFRLVDRYGHYDCYDDDAGFYSCGGPPETFNQSRFTASWLVKQEQSYEAHDDVGSTIATGEGATLSVTFDEPGRYVARVSFYDREFDTVVSTRQLTLGVQWTDEETVELDPGVDPGPGIGPTRVRLLEFPVPSPNAEVEVRHRLTPSLATGQTVDEGRFVLIWPTGDESELVGSGDTYYAFLYQTGTYAIEWESERAIRAGDDPYAWVQVRYDSWSPIVYF